MQLYEKILYPIITSLIIGLITIGAAWFVDTKVESAVAIEKNKLIKQSIKENTKLIYKVKNESKLLEISLDSTVKINTIQHKELKESINKLSNNVNSLTYILTKRDKELKKELNEIKEQFNINDNIYGLK